MSDANTQNLMNEVKAGKELKKSETTHDASAPVIDPEVKVGKNQHDQLMREVSEPKGLNHVETVDKSAPVIASDVHIQENNHKAIFDEIKKN